MGWFTNEDLMAFKPTGGHGDIHWDTQLRKAYRAALKDIGLNPAASPSKPSSARCPSSRSIWRRTFTLGCL